ATVCPSDVRRRTNSTDSDDTPFTRPPLSLATTRPSTRAPRSTMTKPSTTSSLSSVAVKESPGRFRSDVSPSTRRTGIKVPAFSVTLWGSGGAGGGAGGGGGGVESRSPAPCARVELVAAPARQARVRQAREPPAWVPPTLPVGWAALLRRLDVGSRARAARVAAAAPRAPASVPRTATDLPARPWLAHPPAAWEAWPARREAWPARRKAWPARAPAVFALAPPPVRAPRFAAGSPPSFSPPPPWAPQPPRSQCAAGSYLQSLPLS